MKNSKAKQIKWIIVFMLMAAVGIFLTLALMNGGMLYAANISGVETNGKSGASNYVNSYQGYLEYNTTKRIYEADKTTVLNEYTLDYAFVDNRTLSKLDVQKFIVIRDEVTTRASDHRPVFIDFALK